MSFQFPPEIEDEILRIVVSTPPYIATDVHLAVVSKRVQSVIEPILYETVMLVDGDMDFILRDNINKIQKLTHEIGFRLALHSKPHSFFKKNVKNLFVISKESQKFILDVLSICSGIQHLAVYNQLMPGTYDRIWDLVTELPLRSLEYGVWESIIHRLLESPHTFSQLSYLSLIPTDFDEVLITNTEALKYFPELTHFVVRLACCNEIVSQNLKIVLDNVPCLESLIVLLNEYQEWGNEEIDTEIRKWMELDKRVEVIDSPMLMHQMWKERITTGTNEFSEYKFSGHHSEDEDEKSYERDWHEYGDDGESDMDEESDDEDYD